jgi:hypothetical protein
MINSAEEFVALRTSDIPEEYLRAATEPTPIDVWQEIIDRFPEMKTWVAHNKTVPVEILEILARDPDARVRTWVAMKNKMPKHLFLLLAEDEDSGVRRRIAYNKNVPLEIALKLAENPANLVSPDRIRSLKDRSVKRTSGKVQFPYLLT